MNLVNGQAHHESLVAQLVRAPNRYLGGHGFDSLSHARVIVEKDHLHYLLPSLKFTIFIIYETKIVSGNRGFEKMWIPLFLHHVNLFERSSYFCIQTTV